MVTGYYSLDSSQRVRVWNTDAVPLWNANDPQYTYMKVIPGRWNRLEVKGKMNTITGGVAASDGHFKAWMNGQLVVDIENWRYTDDDSIDEFTIFRFMVWSGGGDITFASPKDQPMYFDNIIVSTAPITHT